MKLKELVQIRGAYTEAVDIKLSFGDAIANTELLEKFLPNDASVEALLSVAMAINTTSKERAHLISGAYGTGKSLVGLVIANYLVRPELPELQVLLTAIEQDWPQKAQELRRLRNSVSGRYLPVLIQGNEADTVNEGLLSGLKRALIENQLAKLTPRTAFEIAYERIESWRSKYYERIYEPFESAIHGRGWTAGRLIDGLEQCQEQALRMFEEVYPEITGGPFEPFKTERDAAQFYAQVAKELRSQDTGFEGIVVIWDEYGDRLREVALGPSRGRDYLGEQLFVQYCNERGDDQVHYISIAHLTLRNYFETDLDYENYRKSSGRLKESRITIQRAEEVIAQAILQLLIENQAGWEELRRHGNWQDAFATIKSLGLLADHSDQWIREKVVEGCFPLHPITLYCLPRLSERVGQFNRTSLSFLNDGVNGLRAFIEDESNEAFIEPSRLNLYPVDKLFDYFQAQIEQSDQFRKAYRGYLAGRQFVSDQEPLQTRILKVIAVLEVIQDPKLRPTENIIYMCLYLPAYERSDFEQALTSLDKAGAIKKRPTGEYRFLRGGDYDYQEDFKAAHQAVLAGLTNPVQTLHRELNLPALDSSDYNSRKATDRKLDRQYVEVSALRNINPFQEDTEKRPYADGWILYTAARGSKEIADAKQLAQQITHPQIVIAIPERPTDLVDKLVDKMAADKVVSELLGKGLSYNSDEVEEAREYRDKYGNELISSNEKFLEPSQLTWYWQGNIVSVADAEDLQRLASTVMETVFPDTPRVTQNRIAYKWQRFRGTDRRAALTTLLDPYSPVKIRRSGRPGATDAIFKASLFDTGLLQFAQHAGDYDDYEVRTPDTTAPAYKVWQKLDSIFSTEKAESVLLEAVAALHRPPFGLSSNAIEMFLGAYLRFNRAQVIVTDSLGYIVVDWDGDTVGSIVEYPSIYRVFYHKLEAREVLYLEHLHALVTGTNPPVAGISIGEIDKRINEWFQGLSAEQKSTNELSDKACSLRDSVASNASVDELLFTLIPEALGLPGDVKGWDDTQMNEFSQSFQSAKDEIENYGKIKVGVLGVDISRTGGITETPTLGIAAAGHVEQQLKQTLLTLLQGYLQRMSRESIHKVWEEVGRAIFHDQDNQ